MYLLRLDINKCLQPDPAIFVKKADHAHNIYALLFGALPYLEGTADAPLYLSSAVHQVMEEFHDSTDSMLMAWARRASERPAYMASAETLQAAAASYRIKKETVEHKNRNFLAALAQRNGLTFDQLVSSPTLARHVNAFARDLTTLSDPIWMTICDASLAEIRARTSPNGGPVACPFLGCENRRSLESHSIEEHIRVVHPEQYVEIATSKHRCTLCPASGDARRYKINSLRQHVKDSHRSLRRDL
ncbi:hypothetical protein C8R44DRAFT_776482 [Mycena epipterygia]|nr:hypothetical protein C8R44DRAFT_776482 [Mycena epipterygia]